MKALRKYEKGVKKFRLENVEIPEPKDHEVQVKIVWAGICGTDLHIYHDTYADAPPMTIGHEFSGIITKVGKDVKNFSVGDKVLAETNAEYCGECVLCKKGRFCLCDDRKATGQKIDGVFAEYANLRESNLYLLPENVPMFNAAMAEPLSCVVHAVMERSTILAGDTVLVSGPGPIGLMAVMVAKLYGAHVILSGTTMDASRLELGKELGADLTVDVMKEDLQKIVNEYTSKRGVDVVVECSGAAPAVNAGLKVLRKLGTFTQIGLFGGPASINLNDICYKEINYQGCLSKTDWSW
ncbi:MAG: sorbitol dehydrogenase, partial [Spirochaetia bacterium]|nr:sorbitol dehydrogenase [Spirochaetia bacterium]